MTIENTEAVMEYLAVNVRVRERAKMFQPEGYAYGSMDEFVLTEGKAFDHFSPRRNRYVQRPIKQCFNNAFLTAVASRGRLRYVEGYAHAGLIPVHHAWCCDEEYGVVDTTWGGLWVAEGKGYIGVIFEDIDFVRRTRTNENTSMIDRWQEGYPLLKQKWSN